ncbi:hypothetical protein QFC19_000456 [Naganishia cerealis]|uniref:Uncharacterized protein n=1 Tax=Naganishia cerealis TaxID=610337 RepID=A0ACC2WPY7_9TREE|nr:hypothetical protein QFC19_000456 [Naganishia cerealis]
MSQLQHRGSSFETTSENMQIYVTEATQRNMTGNVSATTGSVVPTPGDSVSLDPKEVTAVSAILQLQQGNPSIEKPPEDMQTFTSEVPQTVPMDNTLAAAASVVSTLGRTASSATMASSVYEEEAERNAKCKTLGPRGTTFTADAMYLAPLLSGWTDWLDQPSPEFSGFLYQVSQRLKENSQMNSSPMGSDDRLRQRCKERLEELCARVPPIRAELAVHVGVLLKPRNQLILHRSLQHATVKRSAQQSGPSVSAKFPVNMSNVIIDSELITHLWKEFENAFVNDHPWSCLEGPCDFVQVIISSSRSKTNNTVLREIYNEWRSEHFQALHQRAKEYTVKIWVKDDGSDVEGELRRKGDGRIVYSIP